MSKLTIKTDNKPRELLTYAELPAKVMREYFDYIDESDESQVYTPRFFKYRNYWYDVNEFFTVPHQMSLEHAAMRKWDGYQSDSYFSGILIRWPREERGYGREDDIDFESVIVGTYYS